MLGGVFGYLDKLLLHHAGNELGAFALVGMGAVFAGIIRAPITSVLIIFEMTGSYELILPLMISNMTAYALARHFQPTPIYEALLEQDEIHLPHPRGRITHALERLRVDDAMTSDLVVLRAPATVATAFEQVSRHNFSTYPVLDDEDHFIGLVSEARVRRTIAENGAQQRVGQLVHEPPHVLPDFPLVRAVLRMNEAKVRQLAVVETNDGNQLLGLLTISDILRAQATAAQDAVAIDRTVLPDYVEEEKF